MARVVKAVLLLGLAFVGLRLAQPRIRAYSFAQVIKDEVESKQVRPSPSELHDRVVELAKGYGLNLNDNDSDDDVTVTPLDKGGFEVKVHYDVPVDLGFKLYQEHFDFVTRTRSAALPQ
jgi:hypothetical protein